MINFIEQNLGYTFHNKKLIFDALKHSSIKKFARPFERLEFLGDRVLGVVIAEYIFKKFRDAEGAMARMHSAFVCAEACHKVALKLGVDRAIQTAGKQLHTNKTVLADAMEAILGAVFIDSDYNSVKRVILSLWMEIFDSYDEFDQEPKTQLQEICQSRDSKQVPIYDLISVTGPDHAPEFRILLRALDSEIEAVGHSRKEAESLAARSLLMKIRRGS